MDLHIKTKFEVGQEVRLIYRNKQEVADFMPCTFCDGNGFFIYKDEKCTCPKCIGGRIRTEKRTAIKYSYYVHPIKWKVSSIRITINKNNDPVITYRLIGINYYNNRVKETADEKQLFDTYKDAKEYCDEQNSIQIGGIDNARYY